MASLNLQSATEDLTPAKALDILVQSVYIGQSRGVWRLEEVPVLLKAVQVFLKETPKPSETK